MGKEKFDPLFLLIKGIEILTLDQLEKINADYTESKRDFKTARKIS